MALEMVVLATLLSPSHGMNPILAGLACSFLFKLSLNLDLVHQGCIDLWHGIGVLQYRIGHMGFGTEPGLSSGRRQQTLQILYGRVMNVRRSPALVETCFDDLTMLSL
ncbi:hypothetical protein HRI_003709500 [Hibiscus trionum]|uniref:Uncharacterized protein n=1 Tax=Hibiscus trionum TaxID=183268 RepID=A0A9W7ISX1_HIBTR|nr:hypothetical protein HRI_003709500 [Hibiscus trionum]